MSAVRSLEGAYDQLANDDECLAGAAATEKQDMTCYDWFFCTKKIDKEEVMSTILKK